MFKLARSCYREYNYGGIKTVGRHFVSVDLSQSEAKLYLSRVIFSPSDWLFSLPIKTVTGLTL